MAVGRSCVLAINDQQSEHGQEKEIDCLLRNVIPLGDGL